MKCHICGAEAPLWERARILGRHDIAYYRCPECGFIETEEPYWLDEAYSEAIADADIGLAGRNYMLQKKISAILKLCAPPADSCLDYGGGYGLFVRLMRDAGFAFEWYDKYCQNIFAKQFVRSQDHYDVVTAFELLEHLPNPYADLDTIMELGDTVICSTSLQPAGLQHVADWWYFATSSGQHIAFYTPEAMQAIARHYQRHYLGCGDIHIFSRQPLAAWRLKLACRYPGIINRLLRRPSLLGDDFRRITGETLN